MAGIYNRDNFAQLLANAIENAQARRQAYVDREAQRTKENAGAIANFAKALGRTYETLGSDEENSPEYRAARFDYIVDGDRSGLDAYQNALNAAIQNKLSRDAQERMLKAGKEQADDEAMDQWQKDYSFAKSAQSEIYNNPASTQKQKDDADATVRYYESVGNRKGYLSKYKTMTAAPAATPAAAPAATETPKETFKQLMGRGQTLEKDEDIDAWIEDVKKYTGNDAVVGEAYEGIGKAQDKKKANADSRWNEYNSRVKAALDEKNYKKRKAALEPLKEELANYKGQEKYAEVEKSINDGLKKPVASPVVGYIKNLKAKDLMGAYTELRKAKVKVKTDNAPIGDKSYPYKIAYNNDGSLTVSGGGYSNTFKASDFSEESLGNEKKPEPTNTVATVLSGGGDGKKANRGSASRKARVAEPED